MRNQRIIIFTNSSWNIYNFRLPLINKLTTLGYHLLLVAPVDDYTKKLKKFGLEFVELGNFHALDTGLINNIKTLIEFRQVLKRTKPDIILSFTIKSNITSGLASLFSNISFIPTLTGLGSLFVSNKRPNFWLRLIYKMALKRANKIVFHNPDDLNEFINSKYVTQTNSIVIPGSGVNIERFKYSPIPKDSTISFLCIARLIKDKGVDLFMEASRKMLIKNPSLNISFKLFGNLDLNDPRSISEATLLEWAKLDKCFYGGFIEKIEDEINKSTVFVLPTWREGMPRAVLESMSMGRPVIGSDVPGSRQVVKHDLNGLLVQPNDLDALINAMMKMTKKSNTELNEMGRIGHQMVINNFSADIISNKYVELIN